jgi:hypothetical protein
MYQDWSNPLSCYGFLQDQGLFGVYLVAPDNKLDDLMWYTLHYLVNLVHRVRPLIGPALVCNTKTFDMIELADTLHYLVNLVHPVR